jgi:hypothetical protein
MRQWREKKKTVVLMPDSRCAPLTPSSLLMNEAKARQLGECYFVIDHGTVDADVVSGPIQSFSVAHLWAT